MKLHALCASAVALTIAFVSAFCFRVRARSPLHSINLEIGRYNERNWRNFSSVRQDAHQRRASPER
jgi:hypothetical protein